MAAVSAAMVAIGVGSQTGSVGVDKTLEGSELVIVGGKVRPLQTARFGARSIGHKNPGVCS